MTTAAHPRDRLSAHADGELPADERAAVEAHLRECAACRQELEDLRMVDEAALALPVRAPEGYFDSFPARVRERLAARRRRTVPRWTWAAAAALLLAVLTPLTLMDRKDTFRRPAVADAPAAVPAAPPAPTETPAAGSARALNGLGYVGSPAEPLPRRQPQARREPPAAPKAELGDRLARRDAGAGEAPPAKAELGRQPTYGMPEARMARPEEERDANASGGAGAATAAAAPPPPRATAMPARPKAAIGQARRETDAADDGRAASSSTAVIAETIETQAAAPREGLASDESLAVLAARPQTTAAEARAAAAAYRAYAQRHRGTDAADEARVRAMEALATAWHLDRRPADRDSAQRDARLYLAAPGPRSERVRALQARLER